MLLGWSGGGVGGGHKQDVNAVCDQLLSELLCHLIHCLAAVTQAFTHPFAQPYDLSPKKICARLRDAAFQVSAVTVVSRYGNNKSASCEE